MQKITNIIQQSQNIVLIGHKGGDPDCYGALFGLKIGLETLGKKVDIISTEAFPKSLDFLLYFYTGEIKTNFVPDMDLLIVLDCSSVNKLVSAEIFEEYKVRGIKILQVDHHTRGDLSDMVDYSLVDEKACSTSEIIYNILSDLRAKIDKNCATCLLAGIIGDTSSYQNQNTTKECYTISSELMKIGARNRTIADKISETRGIDSLKIWGLAMERLSENKKYGVVGTFLTHNDIKSSGISPDVASGMASYLNSIKGARVVALIIEENPGTIKVSLRTRDPEINVANIAKVFGGGGHVKAAGFSFPGTLKMLTEGSNSHIVIM
jgi:phosphoesterase RecJ-like protein